MTILVQSFLNSATKLSTTATTATTVAQLKTLVNAIEGVSTSVMEFYIKNDATTATVLVSGTLGSYGITTATTIYSSNIISALTIPTGITATSYTQASSYLVAVGTFNYDAYGNGFAIRKDSGAIDAYMAQVIALGAGARNWTFVPGNGQPSFTRSMSQPDGTNTSNDPGESGVAIWNITTENLQALAGAGAGQLNTSLIPNGTSFVIYATELGGGGGADKAARQLAKLELAQLRRQADGDTSATFYRAHNTYDITQLPTTYRTADNDTNNVVDNPNVGVFTLTSGDIQLGIRKVTYSGYHNDNVAFTNTATVTASTTATNFTIASIAENTTVLYTGYLLATYTGDWTFTLTSDDSSYLWIGANAVSGYTNVNQNVFANYNTVGTVTVSMTAGEYYPIRLLYGNGPSVGNLNLTYAHTGQSATSDFTGKLFSPGVQLIQGRPWATVEVYTGLTFTYGQATISFTLAGGIFYNVTCPYGAGGYPYGEGVVPVITMPGNQLTGGTTPANDIQWEYTVDTPGGAITGFTYRSGTPP